MAEGRYMPADTPIMKEKKQRAENILKNKMQKKMIDDAINENMIDLFKPKIPVKNPEKKIDIA